jgi:phage replication O-like protein O
MSATPQLEDGFLRIANELLEALLAFKFTHREMLVLMTIIRKTYGYGKKTDDISASQIGDMCNLARPHVTSTLNSLALRNVISKRPGRFGSIIGIQKNHRKWIAQDQIEAVPTSTESVQGCTKSVHVPNQYVTSTESVQVDSTKSVHTKDNLPKDNQQKKGARVGVTFRTWLEQCRNESRDPIPEDDPIFDYMKDVKLPMDYLRFAWVEFKRKYGDSDKKYKKWTQHFQNAIRENWYGVWFEKDGHWQLTTRGKQIEKEIKAKS